MFFQAFRGSNSGHDNYGKVLGIVEYFCPSTYLKHLHELSEHLYVEALQKICPDAFKDYLRQTGCLNVKQF